MLRYSPRLPSCGSHFGFWLTIDRVALQHLDHRRGTGRAIGELAGRYQVEVVGGSVVLGIPPVRRAREAPDRQIEAGRAELPLVVAVRRELDDRVASPPGSQHVRHHPVDLGVAPPAPLVGAARPASPRHARTSPCLIRSDPVLVPRQPRDRADRAGDEQEPVGVTKREARPAARPGKRPPRPRRGCRWPATDGTRGRRAAPRRPSAPAGSTPRRSGGRSPGSSRCRPRTRPPAIASSCRWLRQNPQVSS